MLDSELYNKAADMIERGWTTGAFARDEQGCSVYLRDHCATSWCLSGALWLVVTENAAPGCMASTLSRLSDGLGLGEPISQWNDRPDRTGGQVEALLRNASIRSLSLEGE